MDQSFEDGHAFAIPDLWKTSGLTHFDHDFASDPTALHLDPLDIQDAQNDLCETQAKLDVQLPDPSHFAYGPVEHPGTLDTSSVSSSAESIFVPEVLKEDIWAFSGQPVKAQDFVGFNSWERFYDKSFQEPRTVYISETGPSIFDAALASQERRTPDGEVSNISGRVIQLRPLLSSLSQLGLGRQSILYRFSEESKSFYPLIEDARSSGYSLEAFRSLSSKFIVYGNQTRQINSFIHGTRASTGAPASLLSIASSFSDVLAGLHGQMGGSSPPVRSLLQLQSQFEHPGMVVSSLSEVVTSIQDTAKNEEILSSLYRFIQNTEHATSWLSLMMLRIFKDASEPWLTDMSDWIGLQGKSNVRLQHQCQLYGSDSVDHDSSKPSHNRAGQEATELDHDFEPFAIPNFVPEEEARVILETGRSLRLLKLHQPAHPLLDSPCTTDVRKIGLEWCFSWEDIQRVQEKAKEYESTLKIAIKDFDLQGTKRTSRHYRRASHKHNEIEATQQLSEEAAIAYIGASISAIEKPLSQNQDNTGNSFSDLIPFDINNVPETFAPPMSLVPILSFDPLISVQAHLTNRACLRLLFKDHDLCSHIRLLHRYSLFGDGVFTSALSYALFDPELQTAERRKGHSRAGKSGLKLGSRDTWPPASSELRLVLMGILTDSYHCGRSSSMFRNELPGSLSFSIRELSEAELQRCMNPDSIEALDFLKLEYKPPSPLDAVITPTLLLKYDAVFKLLLRAVRMLFVVNQFFNDTKAGSFVCRRSLGPFTQSFKIECHHFISVICAYMFDRVQANWATFIEKLEEVEKNLDQDGTDSLPSLRDLHERVLDRMMFALILRKRQAQVMKLLEEIFSLVLQFARHIRLHRGAFDEDEAVPNSIDLKMIYEQFKKKVQVFVSVCRGLRERRGQGGNPVQDTQDELSKNGKSDEEGDNTIGQLLLKLEMSGFYAESNT